MQSTAKIIPLHVYRRRNHDFQLKPSSAIHKKYDTQIPQAMASQELASPCQCHDVKFHGQLQNSLERPAQILDGRNGAIGRGSERQWPLWTGIRQIPVEGKVNYVYKSL
ncbi:hypothetical protein RRG08_012961 [Elysia crispata]|uniref:Uncharacterized protein n=1 Tax=Elysia crispata TaxID=231223 RepID=A0AAE0ZZT5_9GAST|nr:hypothetical protein RRG08_012961 [Elysia crispata]